MQKNKNISGGGAKTNINGLSFEQKTDLQSALLAIDGYKVNDSHELFFNNEKLGIIGRQSELYRKLLLPKGINHDEIISKQLRPDDFLYLNNSKKIFIIEKKFQSTSGSVDEKLQTCEFKLNQYKKLFTPLNIEVVYLYVLCDWFLHPQYEDVLEFIKEKNCHYFFNKIPLDFLELPQY